MCVVSTFEGTTNDFMEMFNWVKEESSSFASEMEVGIIREGKLL